MRVVAQGQGRAGQGRGQRQATNAPTHARSRKQGKLFLKYIQKVHITLQPLFLSLLMQSCTLTHIHTHAMHAQRTKLKKPEAFDEAWSKVRNSHGVLIPGGFGDRGVEGTGVKD